MSWSAARYVKFEDERTRPVRDLLAHIPTANVANAADIGCGPGNSTEQLAARFPEAAVMGIDSSPNMIEAARKRLPGMRFEIAEIAAWTAFSNGNLFDVMLSNAVLQWVPDHAALLPKLMARLAPGGSLAVQIPDNLDEPAQTLMREVAAEGPWASKLEGAEKARTKIPGADWYYRTLKPHAARVDIWRTTYYHPLAGAAAIVEWFKGTGLRPFLNPLEDGERSAYLARYEAAIARTHPALPGGTVLLPFPRLFIVATR